MRVAQGVLGALLVLGVAAGVPADEGHRHDPGEKLGKVSFPVSCSAAARAEFTRGVALLHSFGYEDAEESFTRVTRIDPACGMGYWGVAMSLYHPVWAAANPTAAPSPAELQRGREAVARAAALGAPTSRERDYMAATSAFFKDSETVDHGTRALAFEKAMAGVHEKNPKDDEAAIFYALALLGTASPNDKTYARQKQAAALLNAVLPHAPEHPGVAHYLIHSFDYPALAGLALDASRAYSKIAPSSPHALHMPSHIFTRLGLWDESIESNLASAAAARARAARLHPDTASFDQLHALDYLAYAYLQGAQDEKAKAVLDQVNAIGKSEVQFAAAYAFVAVPARYTLEQRSWADAAALTLRPAGFPWERFRHAQAITWFANALGAARAGKPADGLAALEKLKTLQAALREAKDGYWADQVEIQRRAAAAWLDQASGRREEALATMRAAADLEDSTEKHPVTPGPVLPARELLGDLLLEQGRPAEALVEYEASLAGSPGRLNGLYGAARAAERAGQAEKARAFYARLVEGCPHAEGSRPALEDARAALARLLRSTDGRTR